MPTVRTTLMLSFFGLELHLARFRSGNSLVDIIIITPSSINVLPSTGSNRLHAVAAVFLHEFLM